MAIAVALGAFGAHALKARLAQDALNVWQTGVTYHAWHALAQGHGRIGIGLQAQRLDEAMAQRLGGLTAGAYAHLWVSDTGIGMAAALLERIFEPFFTTKPVGQGTGLGLSVVHGIMSAHHGAISVESTPGQGSIFHLYFPMVESGADDARAQAVPAIPAHGHGEHVLYVDDDETMVVMVERLLQRSGYRVSAYHDAHQAIEAVRHNPQDFDFVVTDFNMPDCSGLEVANELAGIRPELPVVISSGYITEELRGQARSAGVRGLLEKENTFEELGKLVAQILARQP